MGERMVERMGERMVERMVNERWKEGLKGAGSPYYMTTR